MSEEDRIVTGAAASLVASVTALAGIAGHPDEAIAVAAQSGPVPPRLPQGTYSSSGSASRSR